jgi:predicted nucleic acid-binding protein
VLATIRSDEPSEFAGQLFLCPMGQLEYLYSARSATDYEWVRSQLDMELQFVSVPTDILDRALALQRDLAHVHGLWHRVPIPVLIIAETALFHELGIIHVNSDYDRIAAVRPALLRHRLS